ncbi:MAG TPA: poly-gamma-glutamate hydrolase family protein, partial [Blastocatellia bacterium]|nr:poly-gamma-glutamate hydrolase family protein [Blastocatellia bacterium]
HTDEQAERVGKQLAHKCVSVWLCKGFKKGGGAFDRWHITSTDISEESFPKLKTVIGRHFEFAVAFHGWSEDSICIGGSAPPALRLEIKTAVERAISGSGIVVATSDEGKCPGAFNGDDPKNIVNRLGANGIQLEQSKEARARYGVQIADAVADVLWPKIIKVGRRALRHSNRRGGPRALRHSSRRRHR